MNLTIEKSIEGIEQALTEVLNGNDRALYELKYNLKRARIIRDYKLKRKQEKSKNECFEEISQELNESVETVRYIVITWQYL